MKTPVNHAPVWINANPSFRAFDYRIVNYLSRQLPISYWQYRQEPDEPSSLNIALTLLHDYLKPKSQRIDLVGHGTGGLLGLLYARRYPNKIRSLTLLGVGFDPAIDWQAHYYQMRKLLPCSQEVLLSRIIQMMFGYQNPENKASLVKILQQDLYTAPSAHSLYRLTQIKSGGVAMPLMVCGSKNDGIADPSALERWSEVLKNGDVLWKAPLGHHFFHYFFPQQTGRQILKFWQQIEQPHEGTLIELVKT